MLVLLATEFSSAVARLKYEIRMECSSQVTNDIRWLFHNYFISPCGEALHVQQLMIPWLSKNRTLVYLYRASYNSSNRCLI